MGKCHVWCTSKYDLHPLSLSSNETLTDICLLFYLDETFDLPLILLAMLDYYKFSIIERERERQIGIYFAMLMALLCHALLLLGYDLAALLWPSMMYAAYNEWHTLWPYLISHLVRFSIFVLSVLWIEDQLIVCHYGYQDCSRHVLANLSLN